MATYVKFYSFVEAVCEKKHDLGADQLMVALTNASNAPDPATDAILTDLTEIAYTYCSSRIITITSSAQTGGTYKLVLQDLTLSASGGAVGPFQYVIVYNNTAGNKELIAYYSYGSEITLNDGEDLNIDFDDTNGFFQLA
jgi:hypothetical protein